MGGIEMPCYWHALVAFVDCGTPFRGLAKVPKKSLPPELARFLTEMQHGHPSAQEGLELLKAFARIENEALRQAIIDIVERIADSIHAAR